MLRKAFQQCLEVGGRRGWLVHPIARLLSLPGIPQHGHGSIEAPAVGSKAQAAAHGCLVAGAKIAPIFIPKEMGQQKLALFDLTFPWLIASSLRETGFLGRVPGFSVLPLDQVVSALRHLPFAWV